MKKILAIAAISLLWLGCKDNNVKDDGLNETDKTFMKNTSRADQAEIEFGQLATQKSQSQSVKDFGMQMATEHGTSVNELQALADKKGVAIVRTMDELHQSKKDALVAAHDTFDQDYIQSQIDDHKIVIAMFENEEANGKDAEVRAFASKQLPHLREHLSKAEQILTSLQAPVGG